MFWLILHIYVLTFTACIRSLPLQPFSAPFETCFAKSSRFDIFVTGSHWTIWHSFTSIDKSSYNSKLIKKWFPCFSIPISSDSAFRSLPPSWLLSISSLLNRTDNCHLLSLFQAVVLLPLSILSQVSLNSSFQLSAIAVAVNWLFNLSSLPAQIPLELLSLFASTYSSLWLPIDWTFHFGWIQPLSNSILWLVDFFCDWIPKQINSTQFFWLVDPYSDFWSAAIFHRSWTLTYWPQRTGHHWTWIWNFSS